MASKRGILVLDSLLRSLKASSPFKSIATPLLRPYPRLPRTLQPAQFLRRYAHQIPRPAPSSPRAGNTSDDAGAATDGTTKTRKQLEPHYQLTFTCVPCGTRSSHAISKQGYHKGSVLITCPSCRNRHIISDHLNIFGDRKLTIEDLMREKGQLVKRGTLGVDGDIEFWEDDTQTEPLNSSVEPSGSSSEPHHSASRDTRDPSASAAAPSAAQTTTSPPISTSARPHLNNLASTNVPPSTRRQYHSASAVDIQTDLKDFGIDQDELAELRVSMGSPAASKSRSTRLTGFKHSSARTFRRSPSTPASKLDHSQAAPSSPPCKIPEAHLAMLRHRMTMGERQLTSPSLIRKSKLPSQEHVSEAPVLQDVLLQESLDSASNDIYNFRKLEGSTPMLTIKKHKAMPKRPRTRTVYAWPNGATEAVKIRVDLPTKEPQYRKVQAAVKDVKVRRVYTEQKEVEEIRDKIETAQNIEPRPVPGQLYTWLTRGMDSVQKLPPQKLHSDEFDILGPDDIEMTEKETNSEHRDEAKYVEDRTSSISLESSKDKLL